MHSEANIKARRDAYWNHARKEKPNLAWDDMTVFMAGLDAALNHYAQAKHQTSTYRDAHEALRDLFKLMEASQPDIRLIRSKLGSLPPEATAFLLRRARQRLRLFRKHPHLGRLSLIQWLRSLSDQELLRLGRSLITTGFAWTFGQRRSKNLPAKLRLEPYVMGYARRLKRPDINWFVPQNEPRGGRPHQTAIDDFMISLGLLWVELTGLAPKAQRGRKSAFVEVAFLALAEARALAPDTAIKRFFQLITIHKNQPRQVPWPGASRQR